MKKLLQKKNNVKHSWFDGYWFFELLVVTYMYLKSAKELTPAMIYRKSFQKLLRRP